MKGRSGFREARWGRRRQRAFPMEEEDRGWHLLTFYVIRTVLTALEVPVQSMNISLPEPLKAFVDREIASSRLTDGWLLIIYPDGCTVAPRQSRLPKRWPDEVL